MSILEWRGGIPAVFRGTALGTTPVKITLAEHLRRMDEAQDGRFSRGTSKWLRIQNHDSTDELKVYFFQHHADNDEHYVTIQSRSVGNLHVWEGPVEAKEIWVAASAATISSFDVTAFIRRS